MDTKLRMAMLSQELADAELDRGIEEDAAVVDELNRVMQASAALESVMEILDKGDQEAINPSQAEMSLAAVAVDQAGSLMEVPVTEITTAMESYDGSDDKAKIVMEALSDKVKQIWQALVAMAKRLLQWLKDTFTYLTQTVNFLDKRADALVEAVKQGQIKGNGSEIVNDENLNARLAAPGINGKAIHEEYQNYIQVICDVILRKDTGFSRDMQALDNEIAKVLRSHGGDFFADINVSKSKGVILDSIQSIAKNVFDSKPGKAKSDGGVSEAPGCRLYSSDLFVGNIGYYMQAPEDEANMQRVKFGSYRAEDAGEIDLRQLNEQQIKVCLAAWKSMVKYHENYKDIQKYVQLNLNAIRVIDSGVPTLHSKEALRVMRAFFMISSFSSIFSMNHLMRVSRDMFRLCEMSVGETEVKAA
jgi:phiKZ-like phage internal head proteins